MIIQKIVNGNLDNESISISMTEDMTEYFRNYRVKNKDKLASYMSNYMKVYYGDRKDKFNE